MDYNEFLKLLGVKIGALRREKKIKQERLSELVEKTTEHISFIERGERAPSLELLLDLARVLDVPLAHLLDVTSDKPGGLEQIPAPIPSSLLPEVVEDPVRLPVLRQTSQGSSKKKRHTMHRKLNYAWISNKPGWMLIRPSG